MQDGHGGVSPSAGTRCIRHVLPRKFQREIRTGTLYTDQRQYLNPWSCKIKFHHQLAPRIIILSYDAHRIIPGVGEPRRSIRSAMTPSLYVLSTGSHSAHFHSECLLPAAYASTSAEGVGFRFHAPSIRSGVQGQIYVDSRRVLRYAVEGELVDRGVLGLVLEEDSVRNLRDTGFRSVLLVYSSGMDLVFWIVAFLTECEVPNRIILPLRLQLQRSDEYAAWTYEFEGKRYSEIRIQSLATSP
ncbi:hypothetical protein DEU56DRAFT_761399 [Suillus clintonianus]|uniref:uncharacterized protein n=1 Tax=Suillus clintonianus TaxID=1904413 RepID=UPI001B87FE72|nr:uncharacterized protein DEU56DRAFT_761399 [Suillus clintonianus]KAG2117471.1 hypothetical protein DEU56DRAFT_761399 [Suillus clintonianus]